MVHRVGSRFGPSDLGLVRRYLRNMVERNDSGYIKTMDVYKDDPWNLDHVSSSLFRENEWYYFVPRTKRGTKSSNRIVPVRGENQGGTWKTTGKITSIKDGNKKTIGYKQSLVYNKKVNGLQVKTNWLMTEFSLNKDNEFQCLVMCWIRYKNDKTLNLGFNDAPQIEEVDQQNEQEDPPVLALPQQYDNNNNNNNIMMNPTLSLSPLPPQYYNNNNMMMMNTMWSLPPQDNIDYDMIMNPMLPDLPLPCSQGQDSGFETIMTMNESFNNLWMHDVQHNESNEQYNQVDNFLDLENWMYDYEVNELVVAQPTNDDYTQQQEY